MFDDKARARIASRSDPFFAVSNAETCGWTSAAQPRIGGHATWEWNVVANSVVFSREWRHIVQCADNVDVEHDVSNWWAHVHEEDVNPFLEAARDIVEGVTDEYQTLFRVLRSDKSWVWVLSRGRVVEKAEDGRVVRVAGVVMDVSFLRSDVKFQHGAGIGGDTAANHSMLENAPDLIIRMGREFVPMYATPNITRYLPCNPKKIDNPEEGRGSALTEEQRDFLQLCVERVFAEGVSIRERVTLATSYGHDVYGEYSFWPELDCDGNVVAAMTQFRDLTDDVLAERRAKLNRMRLKALYRLTQMDNAPEDNMLRFVMDSLVRLTGSESGFLFFPRNYPGRRGRMVWSRSYYELFPPEEMPFDRLPEEFDDITRNEHGVPSRVIRNGTCLQALHLPFGDRMKVIRYITAPVFDGNRVVCIAAVCNKDTEYREDDLQQLEAFISGAWLILRRHEVVRELQRAKEAAEQANRAKDEFLANISHELRTPLNGMLSMLQLLNFLPLSEEHREYVHTADVSGRALLRIISDILDFSRMESGKMELQIEPFDFKNTVVSAANLFKSEAEKKGLQFDIVAEGEFPSGMLGDDARVRQIVFNIVGNALKFTEKGSIRVVCSPLPYAPSGQVSAYFAVEDTGIGIPDKEQDRIFEAFTQIDSSSTRKYGGTGLGLSIVQGLAGLMGGGIVVESEEGKGTTIHSSLSFPVRPGAAKPLTLQEIAAKGEQLGPLEILVAEDDAVGSFALQAFLQRLGHRAVCVSNGRQALELLQLRPFHCLFTDIQMPDMDGLEVIRRIREKQLEDIVPTEESREVLRAVFPGEYSARLSVPDDMVAVTVSAHTMHGDRERFLKAGMDFYISKPIIMRELAEVVQKVAARLAARELFQTLR